MRFCKNIIISTTILILPIPGTLANEFANVPWLQHDSEIPLDIESCTECYDKKMVHCISEDFTESKCFR